MDHRSSRATRSMWKRSERAPGRIVAAVLTVMAIVSLAQLAPVASAQSSSRVQIGDIRDGERVENVLPPASEDGFSAHAYTIDVPAEATLVTIEVDSDGVDLDLAVDSSGPISDFAQVDHLDLGPGGDPSYTLSDPPAGRLHLEILNLTRRRAPYSLTITIEGVAIGVPEPEPFPEPVGPDPSGSANPLAPRGSNPLPADRWAGTFEGDGLEVAVTAEGGAYVGTFTLGTQRYPFEAVRSDGRLEGIFVSGELEFEFVATLAGNVLRVESDGAVYRTTRISD